MKSQTSRTKQERMEDLEFNLGRWSLSILWHLQAHQETDREPGMAVEVLRRLLGSIDPLELSKKLRMLRRHGFIEETEGLFRLAPKGRSLGPVLHALVEWSQVWDSASSHAESRA